MAFARHEGGLTAELRALASQVHPVFMLPPVAASAFGGVASGTITSGVAAVIHIGAIFCAVYTAHVRDGYIDFYVRGEDDTHPLTKQGCWAALGGASVSFVLLLGLLWQVAGWKAVALTLPTWILGILHAPYFDMHPVTATLDYPVGIGIALLGGYYVQAGDLGAMALGYSAVFIVMLSGVSIIDDEQDYAYDRSINKRTVSVLLGPEPARELALGFIAIAMIGLLWGTVSGLFPPGSVLAAIAFAGVTVAVGRGDPHDATALLVRGAYLFFAVLFLAVLLRPFSVISLPDITVFGAYTYLLTELVFGTVAVGLLYRANALRRAARTIIVLYPIAYLWDWYTLEVGVFAIMARTGIDIAGIPLEEHLFMLVVPALILGIHETIRGASPITAATQDRQ